MKINILQVIIVLFWSVFLLNSDSYFTPYMVITILAFLSFYINNKEKIVGGGIDNKQKRLLKVSAWIFSFIIVAANYSIILDATSPDYAPETFIQLYRFFLFIIMCSGSYIVAWNILYLLERKTENFCWEKNIQRIPPLVIFLISFIIILIIDITILFTCKYPGNLTPDSLSQIAQVFSGNYSNHHPFYHTMVIKLFVNAGLKIFGNINAAVAFYHVFQICFMAMCFSTAMFTLYEMGISLKLIIVTVIWYAIMPFNIMYSFTMWKDVMFGGFVLVFLVFIYRILKDIGKYKFFNYVIFVFSSLGMCLFRSNGFFAYVITFICFAIFFYKTKRNVCFIFAGIILTAFLMKHFALDRLGVSQTDTIEALSVPLQQISKVIVKHNDFNSDDMALLEQIVDVSAVSETYSPWISDPMKSLVRSKGNQQYIVDNKFAFIKLYIKTGLKHPLTYIEAWVDETRGFWNGGYNYWRWSDSIYENEFGIKRTINSEKANNLFNVYLWLFSDNRFLQLFLCIGFYVWADMFLCFASIARKDKTGIFMAIPVLAIIVSLLISTPVYAEFRYAYSVFCSLPFVIFAVFYKGEVAVNG